jgi:hypothetical protein
LTLAKRATKPEEKRGRRERTLKFSFMDGGSAIAAHRREGKRRRNGQAAATQLQDDREE